MGPAENIEKLLKEINIDTKLSKGMTDNEALKATEVCPVGAILKKERGFIDPIGKRKYDNTPIGSEIETVEQCHGHQKDTDPARMCQKRHQCQTGNCRQMAPRH